MSEEKQVKIEIKVEDSGERWLVNRKRRDVRDKRDRQARQEMENKEPGTKN